jgi:hypothetical protein
MQLHEQHTVAIAQRTPTLFESLNPRLWCAQSTVVRQRAVRFHRHGEPVG